VRFLGQPWIKNRSLVDATYVTGNSFTAGGTNVATGTVAASSLGFRQGSQLLMMVAGIGSAVGRTLSSLTYSGQTGTIINKTIVDTARTAAAAVAFSADQVAQMAGNNWSATFGGGNMDAVFCAFYRIDGALDSVSLIGGTYNDSAINQSGSPNSGASFTVGNLDRRANGALVYIVCNQSNRGVSSISNSIVIDASQASVGTSLMGACNASLDPLTAEGVINPSFTWAVGNADGRAGVGVAIQ